MLKTAVIPALAIAALMALAPQQMPSVAITHVAVVGVSAGIILLDQTVVIAGERIQSMGSSGFDTRTEWCTHYRRPRGIPHARTLGHACALGRRRAALGRLLQETAAAVR